MSTVRERLVDVLLSAVRGYRCFDDRRDHTFQDGWTNDAHTSWWCDYCGARINRQPAAGERRMTPGTAP
jgi:hypothetical protein